MSKRKLLQKCTILSFKYRLSLSHYINVLPHACFKKEKEQITATLQGVRVAQ